MTGIVRVVWLAAAVVLWSCGTPDPVSIKESVSVTVWSDQLELFMEHPPLRAGVPARFALHLTDLETFKPVREGPVLLEFTGRQGPPKQVTLNEPLRPGLFIAEVTFDRPDELALKVRVQGLPSVPEIEVKPLKAYAQRAASREEPEVQVRGDPVTYLKEQQWKFPFRTEPAVQHLLMRSVSAAGRILSKANSDALIVPPVSGRALAPPQGLPVLGQRVTEGQILGWIEPTLPASQQAAMGSAQVGTGLSLAQLDDRIAQAEARLAEERSRLELALQEEARVHRLLAVEAVPERRLELAEKEVAIRKASLEAAEKSLRSLKTARDRLQEKGRQVEEPNPRIPLLSPVSGTVVLVDVTAGAHVEPERTLFRVIDLSRIWIRADLYETDLSRVKAVREATVDIPGELSFEISEEDGHLLAIGDVVDPQTRTVPVIWEVSNPQGRLKVGMFVEVKIRTGEEIRAVAVPETAVLQEENREVIYVQVAGETFDRRTVETGIKDQGWVEIRSGLEAGERVVVEGAYNVALAARSSGLPAGEGHVH